MPRAMLLTETQALASAEILLRFAAENVKELPRVTVATICSALDAQENNSWDENRATEFWCAFNSLCALVAPATIDTVMTTAASAPPSKWASWFRGAAPQSLARRTATRYLYLLMSLLALNVGLGFLASTSASLSKDVETYFAKGSELTEKLRADTALLEAEIGNTAFNLAPEKHKPAVASIQGRLEQQEYLLTQALVRTVMMTKLMGIGLGDTVVLSDLMLVPDINAVHDSLRSYEKNRRVVADYRLKAQIAVGVLTSMVLPIMLGVMGACAYVVRLVSDQIKDTTFSPTSPIRHLVRVALGGLAGVVIGYSGVVTEIGLSYSALAFIAGYAVEPVFSTLDGIAEKFRS